MTTELTRLVGTDGALPEASYGVWEQDTEATDGPTVAFADPVLLGDAAEGLITRPSTLANDLPKLFALLGAPVQHVALVVHPKTAALPGMAARLDLLATGSGIERISMWAATSGEDLITDVVERKDGFDVLYLDAGLGLPDADLAKLADIAMARKVAVFTAEAQRVADGFLASATPDFLDGLARRVALCLHDAATCPSSASLPAATPPPALTVNAATAAELGLTLPWATQLEAILVGSAPDADNPITLDEAMRRAADQNLAIEAERYALDQVDAQLRAAESVLYPQLGASTTARIINEDLANAALGGASPERLWTLDGTLEQLLFSNGAFGGISIQKKVAALQTLFFEEAKLGVAEEAGKAFLGVLRAQTGVAIARERIQRLTANLDAAQLRLDYGTTSPADVARLRAETASARQDLARALGGTEATRIALNQTLNAPLDAS
ncbi:MAG: TolC family protein, partial [Bacteroidota bacterium]